MGLRISKNGPDAAQGFWVWPRPPLRNIQVTIRGRTYQLCLWKVP